MAHRLAPEAEAELDDIWYYVAKESHSIEIADRLIDSIAETLFLLATHPHIGRRRDEDLRPGLRSFPVGEYIMGWTSPLPNASNTFWMRATFCCSLAICLLQGY